MFAVMGITGNVGGQVAQTLLEQGKQVRGIVRDPAKAAHWKEKGVELVVADYDDRLIDAFRGVEGVFAMIPPNMLPEPGFPDSVARVAAIKKAVLTARPPKLVYLSSIGGEKESGTGLILSVHILERELRDSGMASAFLRPGSFMENNIHSVPAMKAAGKYFAFNLPTDRAYPQIATADIGRIGAETLLQDWQGDRYLELAGAELYSSDDVAAAFSKALGQPVQAVPVPRENWVETMAEHGMPPDRSGAYIEMLDGSNSGWIAFGVPGTEHLKGRIDLETNARELVARS